MKRAIVVGSGAGGCAAAAKLADKFDVTVLEAGGAFKPFGFSVDMLAPLRKTGVFLDERMIQALFPEMRIVKTPEGLVHVNGRGIGGTTQLATGNALRYDGAIRELGIDLDEEFEELEGEVPITQEHYRAWSDLTVRLYMAFEELGLDPQVTPKFMEDPKRCTTCGRCVLGCRYGAKWTADRLLDDKPQVEVRGGCKVRSVAIEDGQARGVVLDRPRGEGELLEADLVVLAAGGLDTPVILNASGIDTEPTLFVDPVLCVAAPWQDAHLDAQLPMPFVSQRLKYILSPYFDWLSFFFNKDWRRHSGDIVSIMIKYADSSLGSYDGKRLDKPASARDREVVKRSVEESRRILEQLGIAREDMFLGTLNAGHPGGCLPLTAEQAGTLHDDRLPANLYVADASLLPQSMGNPPILTIMALAKKVAKTCINEIG